MVTKIIYWIFVFVGAVIVIMPKYILQYLHTRETGESMESYEPPISHRLLMMALGTAVLVLITLWYVKFGRVG